MEVKRIHGAVVLADCYNANPDSTRAALETLAGWPDARRRIAVLGDMLELGREARELHARTAASARDTEVWAVGAFAADWARGAAAAGVEARTFPDRPSLAAALRPELAAGVVVLVKGSRGAALETIVEAIERD
jgi:UDP-N-acetylmuramoyl-tripeptide--D-alanyl-D-alanine ligase